MRISLQSGERWVEFAVTLRRIIPDHSLSSGSLVLRSSAVCDVFSRAIPTLARRVSAVYPRKSCRKANEWNVYIADAEAVPVETNKVCMIYYDYIK